MHLNKYNKMTDELKQNEHKEETQKPQDYSGVMITGHILQLTLVMKTQMFKQFAMQYLQRIARIIMRLGFPHGLCSNGTDWMLDK